MAPTALLADRLIDGTGRDPVENAVVIWEGGRVVAAGARSEVRIPGDWQVPKYEHRSLRESSRGRR